MGYHQPSPAKGSSISFNGLSSPYPHRLSELPLPFKWAVDRVLLRVEHGIRDELVKLVMVRGIGRVRARRLFEAGYRDPDAIRRADVHAIASVQGIGRKLALAIRNAITGEGGIPDDAPEDDARQANLLDFQ